jgi:hypothetical protein
LLSFAFYRYFSSSLLICPSLFIFLEATFYDFPEIVALLLVAGADINAKNFQGANVRETSVMSPKTEALFPVIETEVFWRDAFWRLLLR